MCNRRTYGNDSTCYVFFKILTDYNTIFYIIQESRCIVIDDSSLLELLPWNITVQSTDCVQITKVRSKPLLVYYCIFNACKNGPSYRLAPKTFGFWHQGTVFLFSRTPKRFYSNSAGGFGGSPCCRKPKVFGANQVSSWKDKMK